MAASGLSVLVLHEAIGGEARPDVADALVQVEQVGEALAGLGFRVEELATGLDLEATRRAVLRAKAPVVFNLVESLAGKGSLIHLVPALLEADSVPFTGCGGDAMYLTSQKRLAKRWMRKHGIPTPRTLDAGEGSDDDGARWIVKSVWEEASLGLDDGCVVSGTRAAEERIRDSAARHGGEWFAEEFIDGREFNISLIETDGRPGILPLAEMTFVDYPESKPRIVGYAAKWDADSVEYHATRRVFPALPEAERKAIEGVVDACWHAFGLAGYARVDIRLGGDGVPYVLEINANPCLSRDAGFVAAVDEAGMSFERAIECIVDAASAARRTARPGTMT